MKYFMKLIKIACVIMATTALSCGKKNDLPTVAFIDAFEDKTMAKAKQGFLDALKKNGFSEEQKTINLIYKNAQGNIPTLPLIVDYCKNEQVTLMATCPSISTITALKNSSTIPVFMMVSPTPDKMKLGNNNVVPKNLFGTAEGIDYIDTSFGLISKVILKKDRLKVGVIYNQSESQSVDALNLIKKIAAAKNIDLIIKTVSNSSESQLLTQAMLQQKIDAFFANPDDIVFSSFETIINECNKAKVPVFTSEAGLVARGALAAYGADIYQWGYQAGEQAAQFLKTKSTNNLQWQMVKHRKKVYNQTAAKQFGIVFGNDFEQL